MLCCCRNTRRSNDVSQDMAGRTWQARLGSVWRGPDRRGAAGKATECYSAAFDRLPREAVIYLVLTKSAIVDALNTTFASTFVSEDVRGIPVSIEYPMAPQYYPSIWVNYEDQDTLSIAGIDHREIVYGDPDELGNRPMREVTRWCFSGEVSLTFVALTSLERDNLYDQFVRVYAFSRLEGATTDFRSVIESNDFVALNVNWDQLRPHGDGAAPGTPWNTQDEVVYEKSVGFDVEGEFVSDPGFRELVPLSRIVVIGQPLLPDGEDAGDPFVLGVPPAT